MGFRKHSNLFCEAIDSILRDRERSTVIVLCLIGVLLPFITAISISEGVRFESKISVDAGADLYISNEQYGRNGPVQLTKIPQIKNISGVEAVVPRIVGRTYIGEELAVVVGIDANNNFLPQKQKTRIPRESGQAFMGESLARRLDLTTGDEFHFSLFPALSFTISATIDPQLSLWSSSMIIIPFMDAEKVFKLPGQATELLVYCRPGTAERVAEDIGTLIKPWDLIPSFRVQTKKIVSRYISRGFDTQAGIFSMFYLTAFGLALPALFVLSGLGHGARRQEIGILKATGWQVLEVLELTVFENILLALLGSVLPLLLAMVWLKLANGIGIAPLFISGAGWIPDFPVPARFMPLPVLLSFLFGFTLTMTGTIIPTWRTAITPPATTMGR